MSPEGDLVDFLRFGKGGRTVFFAGFHSGEPQAGLDAESAIAGAQKFLIPDLSGIRNRKSHLEDRAS
jgi:hypothetical protein